MLRSKKNTSEKKSKNQNPIARNTLGNLNALPNEIIVLICSFLKIWDATHFSKTCRFLNQLFDLKYVPWNQKQIDELVSEISLISSKLPKDNSHTKILIDTLENLLIDINNILIVENKKIIKKSQISCEKPDYQLMKGIQFAEFTTRLLEALNRLIETQNSNNLYNFAYSLLLFKTNCTGRQKIFDFFKASPLLRDAKKVYKEATYFYQSYSQPQLKRG